MKMKAATIRGFGDVNVLKYEEIATPKPKPGQVLIKILAAGVNRFDHYIREGSVFPGLPFPLSPVMRKCTKSGHEKCTSF